MSSELEKVFNLPPTEEPATEPIITGVVIPEGNSEDSDFDTVRGNYHEIIDQGRAAIGTAMLVAEQTQNPRAIEVLSGLLKNVADINRQLLLLSKDKAEIKNIKGGKSVPQQTVQNQNVFLGSSSELNKMISDRIKANESTNS